MAREIKFRGVSATSGEMIYGDLVKTTEAYKNNRHGFTNLHISKEHADVDIYLSHREVSIKSYCEAIKPETVGQYTGLKDKNGVEIYEGDIVDCWDTCGFENVPQSLKGEVVFNGGCFCVKDSKGYHNRLALTCAENVEVIGNIHQNPELLG